MLRSEPEWAEKAAAVSALAKDITEVMRDLGMKPSGQAKSLSVAYHSACSLQHGQKITALPKQLLAEVGFTVREVRSEEHTSELKSLMRISYAVFCLNKKNLTHISLIQIINISILLLYFVFHLILLKNTSTYTNN